MTSVAKAPLLFIAGSVAAQAGALASVVGLSPFINGMWPAVISHVVIATTLAWLFRLTGPWIFVNALVAPATIVSTTWPWAGTASLCLGIGLILTFAPALWTRVPYYPTSMDAYALISKEIPEQPNTTFIDIGCGLGTLLKYVAKERPEAFVWGIELGVVPFIVSKIKTLGHSRIQVTFGDFWNLNFERFDVVYAFLSPAAMARLWEKVSAEMRPGTIFITNAFEVPADAKRTYTTRNGTLYVFEM